MEKPVAAIEISNKSIKLVIGYELNGKICTIYSMTKPIGEVRTNGEFIDLKRTISDVSSIKAIYDDKAKLNINISEAVTILPPEGLSILATNQVTAVSSEEGKVGKLDVRNLFLMIKKNGLKLPEGSALADIIPDQYVLDGGQSFVDAPIGYQSQSLILKAKVHVLPKDVKEPYEKCLKDAGIAIKKSAVAPYAASSLINTYKNVPSDYILVDMGARETTVSIIANKQLFSSQVFYWGGDNITDRIVESFAISESEAEKIKCSYGIDKRTFSFKAPVCKSIDGVNHFPNELNAIIKSELEKFTSSLNAAISNLLKDYSSSYKSLPTLLIGGASMLNGLEDYLLPKVESVSVKKIIPTSLGCRNPSYMNLLGMIYIFSQSQDIDYSGGLKVPHLGREE